LPILTLSGGWRKISHRSEPLTRSSPIRYADRRLGSAKGVPASVPHLVTTYRHAHRHTCRYPRKRPRA
jgi:hypothetical protein